MRVPFGGPRHDTRQWQPNHADRRGHNRRVALTLQPSFASWRMAFIGRPPIPIRGLGVIGEFDVQVWRTLWLRLSGIYSAHPVESAFARNDDDEIVQTAASGVLQSGGAALGAAYAFDLGRVLPLIEVGVGGLIVRTPEAVQAGQRGGECNPDGTCDAGLRCSAAATCELGVLPTLHAGLGVDILLARRWSAGAGLRYYAVLTAFRRSRLIYQRRRRVLLGCRLLIVPR
ncbi:MAG: hypothetical protein AAF721_38525 [Myxococcota bacterium]